jgi:formamidopyrimidine-DNA glycosylase
MPESAEVKITTNYLQKMLENKIITDWEFIGGQYGEDSPKGFDEFKDALPLIVEEVKCKGKFIYMTCFNEYHRFFIMHSLRLTGSWRESPDNCSRWYIEFDQNGTKRKLWLRDPRCMATLHFTENEDTLKETLLKLGPDILTDEFTLQAWRKIVQEHKNKNITSFLMDQHILSGVGNYIKAEALYYAKISPMRKVGSLTENESEKLYEAVRIIPRLVYNNRGLSNGDYTAPDGKKGFHEFHLKIYNQKGATRTKTSDGRYTWWDPKIQV